MLDKIKDKMVDDWREAWRWWSVQKDAFAGVLFALFIENSDAALGIAGITDNPGLKLALAIGVGVMWVLSSFGLRVAKQGGGNAEPAE